MSLARLASVTLLLLVATPLLAGSQAAPTPHRNLISLNPLAIVFGLYGAEYERAVTRTTSLAVHASHWSTDSETTFGDREVSYTSAELKGRLYPNARVFQGFSFGAHAGLARLREDVTAFGEPGRNNATALSFGFELGYSWLIGEADNFYVGTGIGAKRLAVISGDVYDATLAYPTVRLSVGLAF